MSKICPNCGVKSPDHAKFCVECAESLEGVAISEDYEEEISNGSGFNLPIKGILIAAFVLVVIIGLVSSAFDSDGGDVIQKNMSVTFSDVYTWQSDDGTYFYDVEGFFNNVPKDIDGYYIKTIYCDENDNELTSDTKKLSYYEDYFDSSYSIYISSTYSDTYLDVDHVKIQIIKDGNVLNEFSQKMNTNQISVPASSNSSES